MAKKTVKDVLNSINSSIDIFPVWVLFVIVDIFIFYFNESFAIFFAILMIPIFVHDILIKLFKTKNG